MSLMSAQQRALEKRLRLLFDELDDYLEDKFKGSYDLHPNRLPRGKAARVAYDGLFSTGTKFTLGIGSEYGRGYLVDVEVSTLEKVDPEMRSAIDQAAFDFLKENLPKHFPKRDLKVVKDGQLYKIIGDFSLSIID